MWQIIRTAMHTFGAREIAISDILIGELEQQLRTAFLCRLLITGDEPDCDGAAGDQPAVGR